MRREYGGCAGNIIYNLVGGSGPDFLMYEGSRLSLYSEKYELKFSTDFDSALTEGVAMFFSQQQKIHSSE